MPRTKSRRNKQLAVTYNCQSRSNRMQQLSKSMARKSAISKRQHHVLETSRRKRHLSSVTKTKHLNLSLKTRPTPTHRQALVLQAQLHNIKERFPKAICWEDIKIPLYLETWFKKINKSTIRSYKMKSRRQDQQTRWRAGKHK